MQSRYARLIRHRYKRLSKYVHNKETFTSCDNPLPNKFKFYFNKNYQSLRSLFFNSQFVLLSRFRTDEDSAAIAIVQRHLTRNNIDISIFFRRHAMTSSFDQSIWNDYVSSSQCKCILRYNRFNLSNQILFRLQINRYNKQ